MGFPSIVDLGSFVETPIGSGVLLVCFSIGNHEFRKRGLLEKGSFQKSPFSRDSRAFRDFREILDDPQAVKKIKENPTIF